MKATEQYSPVVLFIVLYKVVLHFESVDEIQCDHSILSSKTADGNLGTRGRGLNFRTE